MSSTPPGIDMRAEIDQVIPRLQAAITAVVTSTDDRPAFRRGADELLAAGRHPLPDRGSGAIDAIDELLRLNDVAGANTAGPRCFHFVIGGSTPAALAADVMATAYDQMAYTWLVSPTGVELERRALDWLKELFGLPTSWSGVMVTGGSMANFAGLAAGRQWWGEAQGVDVSEQGLSGLPPLPVVSSGFLHASTRKALAMLGIGRGAIEEFARDDHGRLDMDAMRAALESLDGAPAIMVVNAGEVNGGEFDPVAAMIDLARQHHCWVHVDGAFGLFARLSPRTEHLVRGVEGADSVAVDGHKWLNVPYDSGYAFVRDEALLARAFRYSADYLADAHDARPTLGTIGPENSRRARGFAVWATLRAYGRDGHRQIVEHCLDLAQHLASIVEESPLLELLAEPQLNIVPFRYNPGGIDERALDELNERLGAAVNEDGRFLVGTTKFGQRTAFRPAFANWRTRRTDVEEFVDVLLELARAMS